MPLVCEQQGKREESMKPKALIVDDLPLSVDLLEEYIKEKFEVKTAFSGQSALAEFAQYRPDIVFVDAVMPNMSGIEVCQKLRQDNRGKAVYIVMICSQGKAQEVEQAYEAGVNAHITKPFMRGSIKPEIEKFYLACASEA